MTDWSILRNMETSRTTGTAVILSKARYSGTEAGPAAREAGEFVGAVGFLAWSVFLVAVTSVVTFDVVTTVVRALVSL